ncbi:uncharacterized protein LOC114431500 [Parambassis ranga]|uniref:Uncharacterized protein LOC114431500 n=1 Tax=Parambassis ranga TaxID=210632 RepID=A0A6P7HS61_9TELE|nr:uncharacterized protein LOC114431500 [Parambassis ranga]
MEAKSGMDIYDQLWAENQDVADHTLHTPFLQHMQLGDLQADHYVAFMIQDFYYLVQVTDMLKEMSDKELPEDLSIFMKDRYDSYKKYADATLQQFSLRSVSDITPGPAIEKYLSDYKGIMEEQDPIFFAVALLPCERLWLWLANQLVETGCNAYFTWKQANINGHPEDHYRNLLDANLTTPEQKAQAEKVFRSQMQNEHDFFASSLE